MQTFCYLQFNSNVIFLSFLINIQLFFLKRNFSYYKSINSILIIILKIFTKRDNNLEKELVYLLVV